MPVTVDAGSVAEHDRPVSGPTDREEMKGRRRRRCERRRPRGEAHEDLTEESPSSHEQACGEECHGNEQGKHARPGDHLMCRRTHDTAPFTVRHCHASIHGRSYHLLSRRKRLRGGGDTARAARVLDSSLLHGKKANENGSYAEQADRQPTPGAWMHVCSQARHAHLPATSRSEKSSAAGTAQIRQRVGLSCPSHRIRRR